MSAETLAWTVLAVALCGASITGLILGSRWALGREQARQTWHIADPADAAEQDTPAIIAEIEADLDDLLAYIQTVRA